MTQIDARISGVNLNSETGLVDSLQLSDGRTLTADLFIESTSIHLVQRGVAILTSLFPARGIVQAEVDLYNKRMTAEYENVRDFVIAHYKQTQRDDTPFWRQVRDMPVPDSLANRMAVFANMGRLVIDSHELFKTESWSAVLLGQGLWPAGYDPQADKIPLIDARNALRKMKGLIQAGVDTLPGHDEFLSGRRAQL